MGYMYVSVGKGSQKFLGKFTLPSPKRYIFWGRFCFEGQDLDKLQYKKWNFLYRFFLTGERNSHRRYENLLDCWKSAGITWSGLLPNANTDMCNTTLCNQEWDTRSLKFLVKVRFIGGSGAVCWTWDYWCHTNSVSCVILLEIQTFREYN